MTHLSAQVRNERDHRRQPRSLSVSLSLARFLALFLALFRALSVSHVVASRAATTDPADSAALQSAAVRLSSAGGDCGGSFFVPAGLTEVSLRVLVDGSLFLSFSLSLAPPHPPTPPHPHPHPQHTHTHTFTHLPSFSDWLCVCLSYVCVCRVSIEAFAVDGRGVCSWAHPTPPPNSSSAVLVTAGQGDVTLVNATVWQMGPILDNQA